MPGPPRKNNHPLTGYCHNVKALARQQVITANPRAGHARPLPLEQIYIYKKAEPKRTRLLLFLTAIFGPSGESRTHGLLNPIQARYQTALHPVNRAVSNQLDYYNRLHRECQ